MKSIPRTIRDDALWKDVYALVQHIYDKIEDIITNFLDEKWTTASRLRNSANDNLFYTSQAVGNATPETSQYDWSNARKN